MLAHWAGAVRPGLLAAARGPAKPGERVGLAREKKQAGPTGHLGYEAGSTLFSSFCFSFLLLCLNLNLVLEFEFKIGVPYSWEF